MQNPDIRVFGDPILKKRASEVKTFDEGLPRLVSEMARLMHMNKGIGLAAPQIGVSARIIVCNAGEGVLALVNPKIVDTRGTETLSEGCLSVPGINVDVKRAEVIRTEAVDINGKPLNFEVSGLLARIIQHEIDHLDGILIIDRIPKKKLKSLKKRLDRINPQ